MELESDVFTFAVGFTYCKCVSANTECKLSAYHKVVSFKCKKTKTNANYLKKKKMYPFYTETHTPHF